MLQFHEKIQFNKIDDLLAINLIHYQLKKLQMMITKKLGNAMTILDEKKKVNK